MTDKAMGETKAVLAMARDRIKAREARVTPRTLRLEIAKMRREGLLKEG